MSATFKFPGPRLPFRPPPVPRQFQARRTALKHSSPANSFMLSTSTPHAIFSLHTPRHLGHAKPLIFKLIRNHPRHLFYFQVDQKNRPVGVPMSEIIQNSIGTPFRDYGSLLCAMCAPKGMLQPVWNHIVALPCILNPFAITTFTKRGGGVAVGPISHLASRVSGDSQVALFSTVGKSRGEGAPVSSVLRFATPATPPLRHSATLPLALAPAIMHRTLKRTQT